ncbi:hypothetical protein A2962_01470 [Candidatus Woesebacteria bacterium RIFCSPLOWO2_01_FULL_39_61]|uniref:Nudix hydrolase domain-containing protein n=1 Tax=Candidatus Woesebacteria bacterium RIFCSPHIGHO2_02_FULL_39_13 TaxID=1802505 RepID=A0A1F7Z4F1_9BACT|nr:MAG: hypothetical protein A2692_01710 [Candidatus Woesebacteria bacterium RIFCSPHIGHO2_01_FULL_39_95]OGM34516.1 MAG: hypothetical protein A3D01_03160 [Candidatus Woesebacteria bacterium RIFCSPHIGHO2_02_FULL_39_13]OGM38784.1 MAG: hypothetical protein A3E13_01055 [Candidatus Woesebacteria bacterium RIFCSPHIGHO2_12_FULL_40_20]OGM65790.1 MAG: hypothetical protein A2962_01470 [Candidatus Woesebacteria bacterium RIFCSPLOWO2_01_FULL_39_61]OGM73863.1 MAG: hypothetical protein A3H19_04315 [Candidatus
MEKGKKGQKKEPLDINQAPGIVREFSAGGIVFKKVKEREGRKVRIYWLVAKSSPTKGYPGNVWRFTKGWIDDCDDGQKPGPLASGEKKANEADLQNAARREVREEGGVEAKIIEKIGTERYFYTSKEGGKKLKFVTFYLMRWIKDMHQGPGFETEKVEWLEFEKARKKLSFSGEKKFLDQAEKILDSGIQESLV